MLGWLVSNAVFSETVLRIFLIFCMKLGDYKGRKVTEPDFWKKFLIWRYSWKGLQISPKSDTLVFFSKMALTIFLVFCPEFSTKYNLQFQLNFQKKIAILRYLTSKSSKIAQIEIFGQCILVNLNFATTIEQEKMKVTEETNFVSMINKYFI